MSNSFKSKTISGFLWNFINTFSNQGLALLFHILIARILDPSDFGLLGMLAIFISFSNLFVSSGFYSAIIQKKNLSEKDKSSVFYFNVFIALICYFILFFTAPYISDFFREQRLSQILKVYGLTVVIYSFSMVQGALLEKEIDFKKITVFKIISIVFGGFLGIILAYKGFGVWSLVYKLLSASLINTLLLWVFSKWKPCFVFSFSSIKSLFGYSSKLLASGVLHTIYMNIISVILGRYYSASELGYYSQAKRLIQLPSQNLSDSVGLVMFPAFSSIQDDNERIKQVLRKVLKVTVWIVFPVVLFIGAAAEPLIKIFLTEKWLPMTPYLQIICIGGILYPINKINLNLCKAKGKSGLYLKIEIIQKIVLFALILSSIKFGAIALVVAEVIAVYIAIFFTMKMCGRLVNYSLLEQLLDVFPIFIVSLLTMLAVFFIGKIAELSYISLLLQTISSIILYFGISYMLKIRAFVEIRNLLEKYIKVKLNA